MNTERPMGANHALDLLLQWPLVVVILDGYEPRLAQIVTDTIREQSEGTITILWNFASDEARAQLTHN